MLLNDVIERNAQINGRGIATLFRDRSHTWIEFVERCARLAEGLRQLGVQPGARVAILAHNSDRYSEFFFAVARASAVFVPINTRLAVPEIAYWLEDSGSAFNASSNSVTWARRRWRRPDCSPTKD